MRTMVEVYVRAKDADQAATRVALHGYGQSTPENAARMIPPDERVFMVRVIATALSDVMQAELREKDQRRNR
jgi:hypothetical protein